MRVSNFYVYSYIDPRNYEEFYYGKGKGSRKDAHLNIDSDSAKAKRIRKIQQEGLSPIIRVLARNLTESEAFLIETTLLWKLGKWTDNIAAGHFANKFRPHDTLHKKLSDFDYQNGIYYYNVGEGERRNWDDYIRFNFISAGGGRRWRDAMLNFNPGDVFAAYLKRHGFVGIGRIQTTAKMIRDVVIDDKPLLSLPLSCQNMGDSSESRSVSEYICLVEWLKVVPRNRARWRKKANLYTTTHVRASLDGQPETVAFLEEQFEINIREIIA